MLWHSHFPLPFYRHIKCKRCDRSRNRTYPNGRTLPARIATGRVCV